jgi:D-xylose transport system permease protein
MNDMAKNVDVKNVERKSAVQVLFNFNIQTYSMIIALVSIWGIFTFTTHGEFITSRNLSNLFRQMSITGIQSIGMVFVIIAGQIDLSVGSLMGLLGGVAAVLNVWYHVPDVAAMALSLVAGLMIGMFNGWWVAYKKVPSFIVTLGGYLVFRGMLVGMTKGTTIAPLGNMFNMIANTYLPAGTSMVLGVLAIIAIVYITVRSRRLRGAYGLEVMPLSVETLKIAGASALIILLISILNAYQGFPIPVLILAVLAVVFSYILNKTVFGRRVYALGGNPEAAKLSGINVPKMTMILFALNGLMAAVAGVLLSARLDAASVSAGQNAELDAIAACVIGGASLMGGVGSVSGAIVGALVMASIDNGMSMLNLDPFWQYIVKGSVLVLAVWVDMAAKNKK